jgi:two-component system, cell cycle response regulator CpdR
MMTMSNRVKHKNANSNFRIIVVDDEKDILDIIQKYLQKWDFAVDVYYDPVMAIRNFKAKPESYSLLLTDIRMPGMSGIDLAQKIIGIRPDVKVVLMTAFELEGMPPLIENGSTVVRRDEIIRKPFRLADICDAV